MLTILAPIEIKCKAPDVSIHEGFYHKITDPYTIVNSQLIPEDLLHVVTMPPEYFFGGEDETNIFQQTNVASHQENKLEVINNLINRISVSESAQLTYQDRVYITDILQKIGIRNVNEFMKQVRQVKEEQNQTNELINLYWNHAGELRRLVENYRNEQTHVQQTDETNEQSRTLNLHEQILNRLQTAAIYQVVSNFNENLQENQTISNQELRLSEQTRTAQHILLQKLQTQARGEAVPLLYRQENYYEDQQLPEDQITETKILSQINSAVLLDLTNRVYQNRSSHTQRTLDTWIHTQNALYQTMENTMQRIEQHMQTDLSVNRSQADTYQQAYLEAQHQELQILNRLFEDHSQISDQNINELLRQSEENQVELINRVTQTGDQREETFLTQSRQTKNEFRSETQIRSDQIDQRSQLTATDNRLQQNKIITNQELIHQILQQDEIENETSITQNNQLQQHENYATQIVNQLLDRHMSQHEDIHNSLLRQTLEQQNLTERSLQQSENQLHLEQKIQEQGDTYIDQGEQNSTQLVDKRDLSTVEQEISRINRENINKQSQYLQMMENIKESLERPKQTHSRQQLRNESLLALEHPDRLLEQLQMEGQTQQQQKQQQLSQALNVLPEQTRTIYELVREYLEAPAAVRAQMKNISSDPGVLIRDLHEASLVHRQTIETHEASELLHEKTKEAFEHWNEVTAAEPKTKTLYEDQRTDVTLVHKRAEEQLDEEEIRQLIEENRRTQQTVHRQSENVTNYDTTQRTFTNINTQQITEQTENVSELVRQGVQRELGALSEKIYHKLEKRLETEKRRRGY